MISKAPDNTNIPGSIFGVYSTWGTAISWNDGLHQALGKY